MSMASYLTALEQKHQALERQIEDELSHPAADEDRVRDLKRKKLKLKEEITRLKMATECATLH